MKWYACEVYDADAFRHCQMKELLSSSLMAINIRYTCIAEKFAGQNFHQFQLSCITDIHAWMKFCKSQW